MIYFIYSPFSLSSYLPRLLGRNIFISFCERSPDNHTQFQTKMFKIYTRFQTKTAQKPYPLGRHIPIYLIWGIPPPRAFIALFRVLSQKKNDKIMFSFRIGNS